MARISSRFVLFGLEAKFVEAVGEGQRLTVLGEKCPGQVVIPHL